MTDRPRTDRRAPAPRFSTGTLVGFTTADSSTDLPRHAITADFIRSLDGLGDRYELALLGADRGEQIIVSADRVGPALPFPELHFPALLTCPDPTTTPEDAEKEAAMTWIRTAGREPATGSAGLHPASSPALEGATTGGSGGDRRA